MRCQYNSLLPVVSFRIVRFPLLIDSLVRHCNRLAIATGQRYSIIAYCTQVYDDVRHAHRCISSNTSGISSKNSLPLSHKKCFVWAVRRARVVRTLGFLRTVRTMRIGKTKHFRHTMGYGGKKMNSFPKNVLLGSPPSPPVRINYRLRGSRQA